MLVGLGSILQKGDIISITQNISDPRLHSLTILNITLLAIYIVILVPILIILIITTVIIIIIVVLF